MLACLSFHNMQTLNFSIYSWEKDCTDHHATAIINLIKNCPSQQWMITPILYRNIKKGEDHFIFSNLFLSIGIFFFSFSTTPYLPNFNFIKSRNTLLMYLYLPKWSMSYYRDINIFFFIINHFYHAGTHHETFIGFN